MISEPEKFNANDFCRFPDVAVLIAQVQSWAGHRKKCVTTDKDESDYIENRLLAL